MLGIRELTYSTPLRTIAVLLLLIPYEYLMMLITTDGGEELVYHERLTEGLGKADYFLARKVLANAS